MLLQNLMLSYWAALILTFLVKGAVYVKRLSYARSGKEIPREKNYRLTMGIRKTPKGCWLTINDNYLSEHKIKATLLQTRRTKLLQCSSGSEVACEEALEAVVTYLTSTYPELFRLREKQAPGRYIEIVETGELFSISAPFGGMGPLEIAARLAMEDFNILMKDRDGQHVLKASSTCFPVGWSVNDRINWPIHRIHGPVPMWQDRLRKPVELFLSKVTTENTAERSSYFVQVVDPNTDLSKILCQTQALKYDVKPAMPEQVIIRSERQTFKKLPISGAILFAVKTSMRPLTQLSVSELVTFRAEVGSWPEEMARYKGRHCWGECAMKYCQKIITNEAS